MGSSSQATYDILLGKNTLSKGLRDIDADLSKTEGKINMLGSVIGGNLISGGITSALGAAKNAVTGFITEGINGYKNFEQFGVALTTMFHGNKVEAQQLSKELVNFAKTTPYELTEVQNATKQLIAFGSTSTGVTDELKMLGDVGSGIGSSLGDLSYLYGTVRTQGRAMTMDINQFANRGIPIWKELENITGKNGLVLRKFVEDGKVGFPIIQKAFQNLTKEGGQFYNMMDAQSQTFGGKLSNLSDAYSQFQIHVMESKGGLLKDLATWATDFIATLDKGVVLANRASEAIKIGRESRGGAKLESDYGFRTITQKTADESFLKWTEKARFSGFATNEEYQNLLDIKTHYNDRNIYNAIEATKFLGEEIKSMIRAQVKAPAGKFSVFQDYIDIAKAEQKELGDFIRNFKPKKSDKLGLQTLGDKTTGTGTTIEAGTPKNLYINITNFLPDWKIESVDTNMPIPEMKQKVANAFLELISDAYLAQR